MAAPRRALTNILLRAAAAPSAISTAARPAASALLSANRTAARLSFSPRVVQSKPSRWYSVDKEFTVDSKPYSYEEIEEQVRKNDKLGEGLDPSQKVYFIDVREPEELLQTGRIPGALNIPITTAVQSFHISEEDFSDMYGFERPPKDAHLIFYCKAGVRARSAAGLAQHAGWRDIGEYPGSWLDWEARNGPTEVRVRGPDGGWERK